MNTATYKTLSLEGQWPTLNHFSLQPHSSTACPGELRYSPLNIRASEIYPHPNSSAHSTHAERPAATRKPVQDKSQQPTHPAMVQKFQTSKARARTSSAPARQ